VTRRLHYTQSGRCGFLSAQVRCSARSAVIPPGWSWAWVSADCWSASYRPRVSWRWILSPFSSITIARLGLACSLRAGSSLQVPLQVRFVLKITQCHGPDRRKLTPDSTMPRIFGISL